MKKLRMNLKNIFSRVQATNLVHEFTRIDTNRRLRRLNYFNSELYYKLGNYKMDNSY